MKTVRLPIIFLLGLLISLSWGVLQLPAVYSPQSGNPRSQPNLQVKTRVDKSYSKLPLSFEANQGQWGSEVRFLSRGRGYTLALTSSEAILSLRKPAVLQTGIEGDIEGTRTTNVKDTQASVLRLQLAGANPNPKVVGVEELPGKSNYFIGNDSKKWRTDIPTYAKVKYQDVYPGVDLIYYGNQRQLEYDFVIAPGADPKAIKIEFEDVGHPPRRTVPLRIDAGGDLVLQSAGGEIRLHKPFIYQEVDNGVRRTIPGNFVLLESPTPGPRPLRSCEKILNRTRKQADPASRDRRVRSLTVAAQIFSHLMTPRVGFQLGEYDATKPLVIDPVLNYSTYLGGNGTDRGLAPAVDHNGNLYVTGETSSTNFPTTNPLQPARGGGLDVFVTKLNASGSAVVYSTYLGGSGDESGFGIAVDDAGNAYVSGRTASTNFPTASALQQAYGGGAFDAFVAKLTSTGSALIYSTYLGGSGQDAAFDLRLDAAASAYVSGRTSSTNFPTANALQPANAGDFDAFVAKLNPAGSALVYSTYLGGSGNDGNAPALAVDGGGNAYVAANTSSTNFPTINAVQPTYGGGQNDAFVAKLNSSGSALVYSTYLGGSGNDVAFAVAVDPSGNAYVSGRTASTNFPTTNPLQLANAGGNFDAFVAKLNPAGSVLVYSTYLGGSGDDNIFGIAADAAGNAYVSGWTSSPDFPTANPLQPAYGGGSTDAVVAKLNATGSVLVYSTYLGGSGEERGDYIVLDAAGNAYMIGWTASPNFPTVNPLQPTYGGGPFDVFAVKISEILASGDFYFAQAGGGGGFSTAIFLTNPSTTKAVSGTVSFFGSNGRPLEGVVGGGAVPFVIQPSGTAIITTNSQGSVTSGYARVSSSDPVFANATYSLPGVPSLSIAPSAPPAYVYRARVFRDLSRGTEVGIAAVNVSDQRVTAVFSLADSSGRTISSLRAARILATGEQASDTLGALFPSLPASFEGTLQITALSPLPSQSLVVTAVRFGPSLFQSLPLTLLAKPTLWEEERSQ